MTLLPPHGSSGAGGADPLSRPAGGPLIQERPRSVDRPMFLPVNDWVVAVHAQDPETGLRVEMPLRAPQRITPGFYWRRVDESGTWLEPLAIAGESDG